MADVEVLGLSQLTEVGKRLKAADKSLSLELRASIRAAVAPLKPAIQSSLRDGLPKHGGLNVFMANASVGARTTTAGRNIGVRVVAAKKGHDLAGLDKGKIRHPTFGHAPWKEQNVTPNLVSGPVEKARPEVTAGVLAAMEHTAHKITR